MHGIKALITGVVTLVLVVLGLAAPVAPAHATESSDQLDQPRSLILFTDGVDWDNIDVEATPHLAQWAASGTMFNIVPPSIRGWVCPRDVTLAMSAGERLHSRSVVKVADCPEPELVSGEMPDAWNSWFYRMQLDRDFAPIGNVAASLRAADVSYAAVGTAGATFLIGPDGRVPDLYASEAVTDDQLATQVTALLDEVELVAVDASATIFADDPSRAVATERREFAEQHPFAELEPIDDPAALAVASQQFADGVGARNAQRVDAVLAAVEPGTRVYFVSLVDVTGSSLQPGFISYGPGYQFPQVSDEYPATNVAGYGVLGWDSAVRQEGTVKFETLAATIVADAGIDLSAPDQPNRLGTDVVTSRGLPATDCIAGDRCAIDRLLTLNEAAEKSAAITQVRGIFFQVMQWSAIAFMLISALRYAPLFRPTRWGWLNRVSGWLDRVRPSRERISCGPAWLVWSVIGAMISAVPISSHIVTVVIPWWRIENPKVTLLVATWVCSLIIAALAHLSLKRSPYAPYLIIAALTAGLMLQEVATGSTHLIDAPMGFNTLIGARFYGLGNEGFAILAVSLLVVLAFIPRLHTAFQGKAGIAFVAVLGVLALYVVVSPDKGADFGGALALVPALALLLLLISGKRPSWKKLIGLAVLAGVVAFAVAFADWARGPESRTHLGSFVQSILEGEALEIIWRKLSVNLRLLMGSTHRWVVLAAIIAIITVVVPYLRRLRSAVDLSLRHGLIAAAVCMVLAFAVNDSGIVLPGMGAIVSIPALLPLIARRGRTTSDTTARVSNATAHVTTDVS